MTDGGKGLFVTFEGIERSGKGTQIEMLYARFIEEGYDVLATREPGATDIGRVLREILLGKDFKGMDARTEALLFAAARADHVEKVIKPALKEGKILLCDRYIDSSLAYQSFGRGLDLDEVLKLSLWATGNLEPDLTILLKIPVEVSLERLGHFTKDRIEEEESEFHKRIADGFIFLSKKYSDRYQVIDGTSDREQIHREIFACIMERL